MAELMSRYTTKQAGAVLGLKPVTVKWYCRTYPEIGRKHGRDWELTDDDLGRIRQHMADGPGRKKRGRVRSLDKD